MLRALRKPVTAPRWLLTVWLPGRAVPGGTSRMVTELQPEQWPANSNMHPRVRTHLQILLHCMDWAIRGLLRFNC
jgi:hypothetical protein